MQNGRQMNIERFIVYKYSKTNIKEVINMKKYSLYIWSLFIVLSALGVFLFITPINTADGIKVPIAIVAN